MSNKWRASNSFRGLNGTQRNPTARQVVAGWTSSEATAWYCSTRTGTQRWTSRLRPACGGMARKRDATFTGEPLFHYNIPHLVSCASKVREHFHVLPPGEKRNPSPPRFLLHVYLDYWMKLYTIISRWKRLENCYLRKNVVDSVISVEISESRRIFPPSAWAFLSEFADSLVGVFARRSASNGEFLLARPMPCYGLQLLGGTRSYSTDLIRYEILSRTICSCCVGVCLFTKPTT